MKQRINMIGGGFQHEVSSSAGSVPRLVEWVKGRHTANISIHIDDGIQHPVDKNKTNYAWLCESTTVMTSLHQWVRSNVDYINENFELIFTHDESLLELSNKFKLVLCSARPWVKDYGIHKKSKLISMIASSKVRCHAHAVRQTVIKKYQNCIDHYGTGHKRIDTKEQGLNDYMFSIAMENGTYPVMFTEKITDCFATGTIPVYYGTDKISTVFNPDGIIMLTDDFDVGSLSKDLYRSKRSAIEDNYNRTMNLPLAEDYIFDHYIRQ